MITRQRGAKAKRGRDELAVQPVRRALAARVSTEDQAERGTIRAQLDAMRERTRSENVIRAQMGQPPIQVVDEYVDDGVSGTIPLADRPRAGGCSRTRKRGSSTR